MLGTTAKKGQSKTFTLNFKNYSELTNLFMMQFKYIILLVYLHNEKKYRSPHKIKNIASCMYPVLVACQSVGFSSIVELNDELHFFSMMNYLKGNYTFRTLENILSTLKAFNALNSSLGLKININSNHYASKTGFNAKELAIKYSKTQSDYVAQTLYIPSKIHSKLISTCIEFIDTKRIYLTDMLSLLEEDYLMYENLKVKLKIKSVVEQRPLIANAKKKPTLALFKKYNLTQYSSLLEIQKEIRLLATSCIILMLNFSGMRVNELINIKTDGFKITNSEPKLYVLRSYETKISGGQIADYITSPIVKDAFDILKAIHAVAARYDTSIDPTDLFVTSKHQKLLSYGTLTSIQGHISDFAKEIGLTIDYEDVKESDLFNGPREDIKQGLIWPLASHQFRRTLIVNFVAHRLGSINAVKQQVKHMYATMTEYYARNSQLAESFGLHVVKDITVNIEEELLNEGVRQYKQFYYSDEVLSGIRGQEIMEERKHINILSDDEIKQLFKTGLYKISKSMYGYCTKGNLCDKKEAIDPTFCGASCSTMIITKENAQNWQKLYFKNKKLLDMQKDLVIAGVPMSAAKTTMQSQNEVAKHIMDKFNIKYED